MTWEEEAIAFDAILKGINQAYGTNFQRLPDREVIYTYTEELVPCQSPYCPTCTYGDPGALTSTKQAWHAVDMSTLPATAPTVENAPTVSTRRVLASDASPLRPGTKGKSYD